MISHGGRGQETEEDGSIIKDELQARDRACLHLCCLVTHMKAPTALAYIFYAFVTFFLSFNEV